MELNDKLKFISLFESRFNTLVINGNIYQVSFKNYHKQYRMNLVLSICILDKIIIINKWKMNTQKNTELENLLFYLNHFLSFAHLLYILKLQDEINY